MRSGYQSRLGQNELPQRASWSTLTNYNNLNDTNNNHSSSFNEEYRSSSSPIRLLRRTPVCSDNDDEDDDEDDNKMDQDQFEDFFLPNLQSTPGAKQWYMAFPSDNDDDDDDENENELKHNISTTPLHTKSEPTLQCKLLNTNHPQYLIPEYSNNTFSNNTFSNNNSLCSLDFGLNGIDTENLQQQQTDIFSSATCNAYDSFSRLDKITKHQLYSEGVNIDSNHIPSNDNNDGNITMMGYMNNSFGLRLNNSSKIYSEGNIICNESDKECVASDEGTNDTFTQLPMFKMDDDNDNDSIDDQDDDDDLDGFVVHKHETLMGPIHTNDEYDEYDEDDDIFINNKQRAITLMGGLDLKDKENKENENNEINFNFNINEIGITLMGHFENGVDQKIPFKK